MIGEQIHNYKITAHLGQGGMGNVYRATDTMLGREVALKMLHPQLTMQPQFLERFKKEARVLAQLLHPNIAVIYNFIEQGGNHFMVMEYVEGTNLDDLLKQHKSLPAEFIVPVFVQALEGLQHAHRKNIFHRDIKPSNIMLTPDGVVKLMDFGIAKVAGEQKMTQVNKIVGTVEFMAPELIQGRDASNASDIYAAGVTMYEMLSGKLPFESDTDFNLMQAILKERVKSPEKLNASIPKALGDIIMKALEKNPASRYEDARAFQRALMNAFPQYRDVNLEILNKPAAMYAGAAGATRLSDDLLTAEAMRTRSVGMSNAAGMLEAVKENIRKNKKTYFLTAAILIFLFFVLGIVFDRKETGNNSLAGTDTTQTANPTGDNTGSAVIAANANEVQPGPVKQQTPVEQGKPEEKPLPEKTREKKVDVVSKEPVQPKTEEKKTEPAPAEKKEEKKDVYIKSKVEVELTLRTDLSSAEERKDIPVTFSVSYPVTYEGVTIIRQGATATGTIKLGRVLTDIDINSVTAANGQQVRLKAAKAHGKRSEITSERSYTAIILPGTKISF
ncbi:MAG TPA: protein kinase [Ferruginibacter sp.]|nr:protein kinase [Ferruginibacter sp.]HQQ99389.1 protein kinase [Ferruginibacter sp.]